MYSQDPIFTQTFLVPETINTSFTGALRAPKLGMLHRSQWTNFAVEIKTNFVYADTWFEGIKSGIGITYLNQTESESKYSLNELFLNYALAIQLNEDWYFRPSISLGVGFKDFGFQNLLLEDQININTGTINSSTIDPISLQGSLTLFDFSSSLLFNNENSWVGITLRHLNRPNISMTTDGDTPLDIFMSVHANIEFPLYRFSNNKFSDNNSVYFLTNFMMQSKYSRLDIGSQYVYDNKFTLGFLFATNPLKTGLSNDFLTSIDVFAGVKWEGFKFGYSYDIITSGIGSTGGVHEFSVSYDFSVNIREINRFKCVSYF
jgi:type IX secretion system PorP/SprF family membrane protein